MLKVNYFFEKSIYHPYSNYNRRSRMHTFSQCHGILPNELQKKKDIECYKTIMNTYPNYPKIWWSKLVLKYKQKWKGFFSKNNSHFNSPCLRNEDLEKEDVFDISNGLELLQSEEFKINALTK